MAIREWARELTPEAQELGLELGEFLPLRLRCSQQHARLAVDRGTAGHVLDDQYIQASLGVYSLRVRGR